MLTDSHVWSLFSVLKSLCSPLPVMSKSKQNAPKRLPCEFKATSPESVVFCVGCVLQAMEVERAMSGELQALKQELQQKGSINRHQDEELISAMREQVPVTAVQELSSCRRKHFNSCVCVFQVLRLTHKEQVLEQRLESVSQENAELKASLASLHTRLALHDQVNQQHSQQVHKHATDVRCEPTKSCLQSKTHTDQCSL